MKNIIAGSIIAAMVYSPLAASQVVERVSIQCLPTEAAVGVLVDSKGVLVAKDVFNNGINTLSDQLWSTPEALLVLRVNKDTGLTCVLTEIPTKADY
jgi:hypothetical protein